VTLRPNRSFPLGFARQRHLSKKFSLGLFDHSTLPEPDPDCRVGRFLDQVFIFIEDVAV
jgi:hypothetical protein